MQSLVKLGIATRGAHGLANIAKHYQDADFFLITELRSICLRKHPIPCIKPFLLEIYLCFVWIKHRKIDRSLY